jgi:Rod binding domain-containing protein
MTSLPGLSTRWDNAAVRQALTPKSITGAAVSDRSELSSNREKVGKEFEAVFLNEVIESMFPKSAESFFGSGTSGDVYRSLLAQNIAETMAGHGGIGIANAVTVLDRQKRTDGSP